MKKDNIAIDLSSIVDYIRDKDELVDYLRFKNNNYKEVIFKIKEILNHYGNKEDIRQIKKYNIYGGTLIRILELLEETE